MKRLLLLFFLLPLTLFGQSRRKEVIDSIAAVTATYSQDLFKILGSPPGSRLQHTGVIDSGEYVTIVTRIYSPKLELFTRLPMVSLATIGTSITPVFAMAAVGLPPAPEVVPYPMALSLAPGVAIQVKAIAPISVALATPAPTPGWVPYPEAVSLAKAVKLGLTITPVFKTDMISVPALAFQFLDKVPLLSPIRFTLVFRRISKTDTVTVPVYEIKKQPVSEMHLSPEGYTLLEKLEGFSPALYALKDGGFTIGFGFFLPYAEGNKWDKGVTWEEAEAMIRQKMPAYENQVKKYINVPLTQNEFDALTMLAYNLGGFSKATSIVNDINTYAGYEKLQIDWKKFIHSKAPNVAKGLINRRRDEMQVRGDAYYQPERKINILKNK